MPALVLLASGTALPDTWIGGTNTLYTTGPGTATNVGIGLTAPGHPLQIRRDPGIASGERHWMFLDRASAPANGNPAFALGYRADGTNATRVYLGADRGLPLDFRTHGRTQAMTLLNNGNVGFNNTHGRHHLRFGPLQRGARADRSRRPGGRGHVRAYCRARRERRRQWRWTAT